MTSRSRRAALFVAAVGVAILTAILAIGSANDRSPTEIAIGLGLAGVFVATLAVAPVKPRWWNAVATGAGQGAGFVGVMIQWESWSVRKGLLTGLFFACAMTVLNAWEWLKSSDS
jgi:hypothetical protein